MPSACLRPRTCPGQPPRRGPDERRVLPDLAGHRRDPGHGGAILTISAGLRSGRRHALITAVGCTLWLVPHLTAAVTGTAALLQAGGPAFKLLKVAGITYLLALAWLTWRDSSTLATPSTRRASTARTIANAVLVNLFNPKLTGSATPSAGSRSTAGTGNAWTPRRCGPGSQAPLLAAGQEQIEIYGIGTMRPPISRSWGLSVGLHRPVPLPRDSAPEPTERQPCRANGTVGA